MLRVESACRTVPNVPKLKREQPLPLVLFEMTCTVGLGTKRLDPCQNSWELLGVCQARAVWTCDCRILAEEELGDYASAGSFGREAARHNR